MTSALTTVHDETLAWIQRLDVRDSAGTLHRPHGILTSLAHITVYVLFDDNPQIGRRAHWIFTKSLQAHIRARSADPPFMASLDATSRVRNTGAGYLVPLRGGEEHPRIWIDRVEHLEPGGDESPGFACALVTTQLRARGMASRPASIAEQYAGIDLIAEDYLAVRYGSELVPIEVKSRTRRQNQWQVFVQVSETNPLRRT